MNQSKTMRLVTLGMVLLVAFLVLTRTTFLTIEPGHEGVIFKRFGGGLDMEKRYEQGFHVIAPWNKIYIYDVRIVEKFEEMDVLSSNGLTITVELSLRYRPDPSRIALLHNEKRTGHRHQERPTEAFVAAHRVGQFAFGLVSLFVRHTTGIAKERNVRLEYELPRFSGRHMIVQIVDKRCDGTGRDRAAKR